ncbi:Glycoside hydrolase family 10 domain [Arabidopsis suecica]|uniref:Glycoside hydrolase family 10 domain n=1 Tax=Arabidopsis suecica TaxID=45249 RepID=A0A8T1YGL1_ARASU|nr:Glycoside hydrolase family 10 domain [Arabidopsis suecica]
MKRLLLLVVLCSLSLSRCESKVVPYDYSATIECLKIPLKPQYNGGIIVNPDLRDGGSLGWQPFGNAKVDFRKIGNHKFVVARDRKQPYDSVSQKVYLEKGLLYTFSAWLQVSKGKAPVKAVFKKNGEYKHAGSVVAESKCWSMLKGGLTVDESGPAELYFESEDTTVEIWVDSVSLQPFTQEEWNSHHEQSIQKERKRTVKIRAVNSKGEPIPKATISIEQRKLGFPFGCEVEKNILGNKAYQNWFTQRFTVTTFANEMKWYSTEVVRGKEDYSTADAMLRFFKQHGVAVRGHNILWNDPKYQPRWVNSLSGNDLYNAVKRRVFSVVSRYKGQLAGWDVVNENLHFSFFENKMGPKASYNIFKMAQAFDPTTTKFMNEYNTLEESRDSDSSPARYLQKLRELRSIRVCGNISLGIGLESHFKTPNIPYMRSALDTLAATGLPIWLTEVDVEAPPNVQAKYFEQVLREGHAHPQVKGIVTWSGYSPSGCYRMCLTDGNFKNLPTGDVVDKLLQEWGGFRRQTTGVTDADGYFEASLFHGDYDLKIDHPLTNSKASHSFKLTSDVSSSQTQPSSFVFRV